MSFYVGKKHIGRVTVTNEIGLDTYDATATPATMQRGVSAYVRGAKVVGTAKCFEFATYSRFKVRQITDLNGETKYGFKVRADDGTNVFFVAPTDSGDVLVQAVYTAEIGSESAIEIGMNKTTSGEVFAFYQEGYVYIYITDTSDTDTQAIIFVGKDNEL